jgi:DNA-binding response OmpR family regulator
MPGHFMPESSRPMMTPQKNILVVDDEPRLVSLVETYLAQSGYGVHTAANGAEALAIAQKESPDLIILDLMMPVMDGYEFMRAYRSKRDTPIIILTARVDSDDKLAGFELGADDYVTKPFRPRELMARVKAVLRRAGKSGPPAKVLHAADISLDRDNHLVQIGNRYVDLTPSEFEPVPHAPRYIETVYGAGYRFVRP